MPETVPVPVHLFAINRPLTATRYRSMLLCSEIALPTEVGDSSNSSYSSRDGAQVQEAISDGRVLDALTVLQLPNESLTISRVRQIRFLFASAHALLNQGNHETADRCIQMALRILSDGGPIQRGLQLPEWLVLATNALLRQDWQSCGLWLRQCDRIVHRDKTGTSSGNVETAAGDILAIRACVCAERGVHDEAVKFFHEATECHDRGNAHRSAARDLILLSRVFMANGQLSAAELRRDNAEERLRAVNTPGEMTRRLQRAILNDRRMVASQCVAVSMAQWN